MALSTNAAINAILTAITGAALPQSNWEAVVAPNDSNNLSQGYTEGSYWYDTLEGALYICTLSDESTAQWNPLANVAQNGLRVSEGYTQLGGKLTADTNIQPQTFSLAVSSNLPDPSAVFDVQSTTKGFKLPVMSGAQRDAIASPAKGLVVYSNTDDKLYFYNGSVWKVIMS